MKVILDVILTPGTDKQEFVDSFNPITEADLWNILSEIPNCVSMHVETQFLDEFKKDSRIISYDERYTAFPTTLPTIVSMTKTITTQTPSTSTNGSSYMPLQFYLDSDHIYPQNPGDKVGRNTTYDDVSTISNATYKSRWTGKNVDIVTLEVGGIYGPDDALQGVHDTHPDFDDLDNPGTTRVIPMNWLDLEDVQNNQISTNKVFSSHGMGVLSAAAGTICGFAKRSSIRAAYSNSEDGVVECINAIISWHNNKSVNPETGVKNPTIMIGEYQYLLDRRFGIPIDYISSIVDPNGSIDRPGSSWGNDFTPFIDRNIIPFQVKNPNTPTYEWCVVVPNQAVYSSLNTALDLAWDAGIVCITAAGNNGGVYDKSSNYNSYRVVVDVAKPYQTYLIQSNNNIQFYTEETRDFWYTMLPFGPHGRSKGIDVAAGYNSEGIPTLDSYSNRGPGIDIVGLGEQTWTAFPLSTYSDGNKWGMFSGTSCATPTVVGKAACYMERHFYYTNSWPSPNQVKSILISNGREIITGLKTTDWSNSPSASTIISNSIGSNLARISNGSGNGGYNFTDLCGTTRIRAHFDYTTETLDKSNLYKKRPLSGVLYPRKRIRNSTDFPVDDI